jgi:hypothetical protein
VCASGRAEDGLGNRRGLRSSPEESSELPPDGTAPSRPEAATRSDSGLRRRAPAAQPTVL